ncbi:MAG: hypothetical protein KKG47_04830 [Proteobacteria bacterium]|nr:hypothetical protein [Pseudomonadota bacterium]MBU1739199.1 hypothetical protein [Pseudomonadota bacterium]
MDGNYHEGFFDHPSHGLIKIYRNSSGNWVYQCYTSSGTKPLSKERTLDAWTWALSTVSDIQTAEW